MAFQYLIVDPLCFGGAVHPVTLTGTPASKERIVIRDGNTRIGVIRKVFNGMFKGRKVYAWQPFDATGLLLMSRDYEIRDAWTGAVIGTHAAGVSEKIAVEAVMSAVAPAYA